jgi:regulation of enolase protein 1 (concanavalin A-like superfamily)
LVWIDFDLKFSYNGTNPDYFRTFVQLTLPPDQLQYESRASAISRSQGEWKSYGRVIYDYPLLSQLFQENKLVNVEFRLEWSNGDTIPNTAIAWFDNIQIKVPQKTLDVDAFPKMQWNHSYGGTRDEEGYALVQTSDGGFALAGYTSSYGAGGRDIWLVKTGSNGFSQWNHTYGGKRDEECYALVQTTDGGFALAGYTNSFGYANRHMWLVKTDANGLVEWHQTYFGYSQDEARSLIQTDDGGFVIAGFTEGYDTHGLNKDILLVKTDANGLEEWKQTYGGYHDERANALIQTNDNGFMLAGISRPYGTLNADMWLVKTDVNGLEQWNQTYGGYHDERANALIQTNDNGFMLAGMNRTRGSQNADICLVKTNSNGVVQYTRTFGGAGWDEASALLQTDDGGFVVSGTYDEGPDLIGLGFNSILRDIWLVKTDVNGNEEWNQTYGGLRDEQAFALVQTDDGGLTLLGRSEFEDMWLVKTEAIPPKTNGLFNDLILIASLAILVFFLAIGGNQFVTQRRRHQYRVRGEEALLQDDYMGAIQFFYQANDSEKLIEVIKRIILNPDLTTHTQQILEMDNLQEYVQLAYDIIHKSELTEPLGAT